MRRPSASTSASIVCLLLIAASFPACDSRTAPGDVLLITIDALRPDHLGLYGYRRPTSPNLDHWLADAAVFGRAYTVAGQTAPAVVSLLSGKLPQEHRVRLIFQLIPEEVALLPELLPPGYQTAAFVSNTVLTDEAMGIAARFDHYDDFVDERESERLVFERSAARTTDAAIRWLREERDPGRPLFLWIHYIDPHGPYLPPADWPRSFEHPAPRPISLERVKPYMRLPGTEDGLDYVDGYDEEIAYTDHHLGRFLEVYAAGADVDRALVVFTSDHGESMMEHEEWFRHGHHVYEEVIRVPMALRGPGVSAGLRPGPATLLDVVPTILAFTGAPLPAGLPGVDLRDSTGPDPRRSLFAEAATHKLQWRAEVRGDSKWMIRLERGRRETVASRRYDLGSDPEELRPLPWSPEDGGAPLLVELCRDDPDPGGLPAEYLEGARLTAAKVSPRADPEALEKLRALGYVD